MLDDGLLSTMSMSDQIELVFHIFIYVEVEDANPDVIGNIKPRISLEMNDLTMVPFWKELKKTLFI